MDNDTEEYGTGAQRDNSSRGSGQLQDLNRDGAEDASDEYPEVVRIVARFHDDQPSPEHAPVRCFDCRRWGFATPCHAVPIDDATPDSWKLTFVCRDCADRDDPLCGAEPSDLSHPEIGRNSRPQEAGSSQEADQ